MYYLYPYLYDSPWLWPLYLLQGAFTIWMLMDCYRRRAETYWFWVIIGFPGFGAWAYFIVVKCRDFQGGHQGLNFWPFQRRASLTELRQRVDHSPTPAHHMDLGERLVEEGQYEEAMPHIAAMLKREPDFSPALYSLAECHFHAGQADKALPLLEKIIQRDPRWNDYKAWQLLREVKAQAGDRAATLALCQELVRQAPTLHHKCLLAEQMLEHGQGDEANALLERGIADFQFAPRPIRWRNRQWVSEARRLQKRIYQENGRAAKS